MRRTEAARAAELESKITKLDERITAGEKRLANESFVNNAPAAVVQKERDKQANLEEERAGLRRALEELAE